MSKRTVAELRRDCRTLFDAGVRAADPAAAVRGSLERESVAASRIVAFGKAALPMLATAREFLPDAQAMAVTNAENAERAANGERVLIAGHPVPDANGEAAAREIEAYVGAAGEGDTVLVLVSGGGSAMLPAPIEGVTLANKIAVTELLLASGAPIDAINTVRRALSRLKGGGLARAIHPARTVSLLLSDVPRDEIAAIASGPTVPEPSSRGLAEEAATVLRDYDLWDRAPVSVREALIHRRENAAIADALIENRLIGGNGPSLDAMAASAKEHGLIAPIASRWLDGDVSDAAAMLHRHALDTPPDTDGLLTGGETTVVLRGRGKGGRNQELAMRFALLCEHNGPKRPWAFLSGGTDGRDGPTDAAGGLVDCTTVAQLHARGLNVEGMLADNDAYHVLETADALLMTGGTGTNVADLQVLMLG